MSREHAGSAQAVSTRALRLLRCMSPLLAQSGRIEVGSRTDGESHAAIEQSCGKASMNRAGGIEMPRMGFCDGNNAALGNLDNVVAERLRHRVQGQRAVDEPLNKFEAAHCSLLVVIDDAKTFLNRGLCHELAQAVENSCARRTAPKTFSCIRR